MALEELTPKEREIVLRCMKATAAYIDDREKHTRLGLEPHQLQRLIRRWPQLEDADETSDEFLAINNCLNEVCYGFRIDASDWGKWFDTLQASVEAVYRKWLHLKGVSGGIR